MIVTNLFSAVKRFPAATATKFLFLLRSLCRISRFACACVSTRVHSKARYTQRADKIAILYSISKHKHKK